MSKKEHARRERLLAKHMHAQCTPVGWNTHAPVTNGQERKIRMDFSQFSFELNGWQVGLGRFVHLQVNQTKRREK
jgi:hypothetical protein